MADTVVDFINTTKTFTDFQTGVTLVSNSASEQAVVKDIQLDNPGGQTFKYTIGNVEVANSGAEQISGTELIGASRSLVMSLAGNPIANQIYAAVNTNTIYLNPVRTFFDNSIPSTITSDSSYVTLSTTLSTTPYFICFGANGDFYYSNNTSVSVYRRAGGINGAETTIISGSQCAQSFDGRYIYSFTLNTNQMTTYDTQTNTTVTSGTISGVPGFNITNQSSSACLDGYVVLKFDGSSGSPMYLINGANRTSSFNWTTTANAGQRFNMSMGKNSLGNYYVVRGDGSALRVMSLGTSLSSPVYSLASNFPSPSGWSVNDNVNTNCYLRSPSAPRFIMNASGNSPTGYIDLDSFLDSPGGTLGTMSTNGVTLAQSYGQTFVLNSTKAVTDFGTIGVRATGIKTT